MKILVIDNYDSFTYNLVHYLKELSGFQIDVFRNDKISIPDVAIYDKIVISPGPGVPDSAGITKELIKVYGPEKSILGVCLGLQSITEVYDGQIYNLSRVYHGVASMMTITDKEEPLFRGIPDTFLGGRYHSWAAKKESLPNEILITCVDEEGAVMGIRHSKYNVRGVQFHPESILTPHGKTMIKNWLEFC